MMMFGMNSVKIRITIVMQSNNVSSIIQLFKTNSKTVIVYQITLNDIFGNIESLTKHFN